MILFSPSLHHSTTPSPHFFHIRVIRGYSSIRKSKFEIQFHHSITPLLHHPISPSPHLPISPPPHSPNFFSTPILHHEASIEEVVCSFLVGDLFRNLASVTLRKPTHHSNTPIPHHSISCPIRENPCDPWLILPFENRKFSLFITPSPHLPISPSPHFLHFFNSRKRRLSPSRSECPPKRQPIACVADFQPI